ncbi:MAG: cupin domain-containing protein [Halodesulfurarchaeum sp.]
MGYTKTNAHEVEPVSEGMHFLRDPLECEKVGVTLLECDPGWTGMEHDHGEEDHEEVYLLLEGSASVKIDDEDVNMEAGDAVRIDPAATRQIQNGSTESTFVLVGAP